MTDVNLSEASVRLAIAAMSAEGMHHCARVTDALLSRAEAAEAERDALRARVEKADRLAKENDDIARAVRVSHEAALATYHAALGETARVTRVERCANTKTGEG